MLNREDTKKIRNARFESKQIEIFGIIGYGNNDNLIGTMTIDSKEDLEDEDSEELVYINSFENFEDIEDLECKMREIAKDIQKEINKKCEYKPSIRIAVV